MTPYEQAVANLAARGFVVGARIMVNGDYAGTVVDVTDRGLEYRLDGSSRPTSSAVAPPALIERW